MTAGEVDMGKADSNYFGTAGTAQPISRAKRAILEATKRDGEVESDGRRTVHNILNHTRNHQIQQQEVTEKSGEQRSQYTNISELSHTYKQFSGLLNRNDSSQR